MSERKARVLAIDDDRLWLDQVPMILDTADVTCCESIDEGLIAIGSNFYDVILLDLNFTGDKRDGLDIFRKIVAIDNSADVIVISGETRPDRLIQIMNAGVTQFMPKPSSASAIRRTVDQVLQKREVKFRALNSANSSVNSPLFQLVGSSGAMQKLREEIARIVESGAKDVLLVGETGTGKEVVARAIASLADPAKRMVPIHCGAISDGIAESELFGHVRGAFTGADRDRVSAFEAVGGGYVFLDEIGEMPLHQQAKLLRVLQERKVQRVGSIEERPVSFRCISATNLNLQEAIESQMFREDLYYRIAREVLHLPTLRERPDDIPELVHFFIAKANPTDPVTVEDSAMVLLKAYSWPGNVRQLQGVVEAILSRLKGTKLVREREVIQTLPELGGVQTPRFVKPFLGKEGAKLISSEKKRFQKAILDAKGNRDRAASLLKISRATYFRRAKELGLVSRRGPLV